MLDILLVVLALDRLEMSDAGPGLLNSALGIGGMVGAVRHGRADRRPTAGPGAWWRGRAAGVAVALAGLATVPVGGHGADRRLPAAGKVFFDVSLRTFVQRLLPDRLLTAVFGVQESVMMAGLAVGALAAPLLVTGLGPSRRSWSPVCSCRWSRSRRGGPWPRLDASTEVPADRLALLRGCRC